MNFNIKKAKIVWLLLFFVTIIGCGNLKSYKDKDTISLVTNYCEGNCLSSDGERYYYKSQVDMNYLYSSDINGNDRINLAEEIPGGIFIKDEWIYFENLSDNSMLYRVSKNGTDLQKMTDIIMKNMILCGKYFYYKSEENLLCRMEIEQWKQEVIYDEEIQSFITDGNNVALHVERLFDNDVSRDIIICSMEGKEKTRFHNLNKSTRYYLDEDYLYYYDGNEAIQKLLWNCKDNNLESELIHNTASKWTLYDECIYICEEGRVSTIQLSDKKKELLFNQPYFIWAFYILNDEIFVQYIDEQIPEYGLMWYRYDKELNECILLEELPYVSKVKRDRDTGGEIFPYGTEAYIAEKYIEKEIIYEYEKEVLSDLYTSGIANPDYINIKFPQFNLHVKSADIINEEMRKIFDREKRIAEKIVLSSDKRDREPSKRYEACVHYVYVDDRYVCVQLTCRIAENDNQFEDRTTFLYSAETGERLDIKDILSKNNKQYRDILAFAISKYIEKESIQEISLYQFIGDDSVRKKEIEEELDEESFFLTEDGLVVIYKETFSFRGPTTFEIPYEYLEHVSIW